MSLENYYFKLCNRPSDINEHLHVLYDYTQKCKTVVECGVRTIVSSYAFAFGLKGVAGNKLVMVDPAKSGSMPAFLNLCAKEGIAAQFVNQSDLDCDLVETDLLFLDTWHVYGQLKRELDRWNSSVAKYIIMHDTTVDAEHGETVRVGWDPIKQSLETGIPPEEITKGLWPAVEEFLVDHPEWVLEKRLTNNNGLTVLRRL